VPLEGDVAFPIRAIAYDPVFEYLYASTSGTGLLGHGQISIMMDLYSNVISAMQKELMTRLDDILEWGRKILWTSISPSLTGPN